jgi:hypothetical protein
MMSNFSRSSEPDEQAERAHLSEVEDGAGCAEIWARLSERRSAEE